jgi:hypothetical protein
MLPRWEALLTMDRWRSWERREPNREGTLLPGTLPGQGLGFGPHG